VREHIALAAELLALVERENRALQEPTPFAGDEFALARKTLLPRLDESYKALKEARILKQHLGPAQTRESGEIESLVRQAQDLAMKIVMRDRENEQTMLRRGLLPAGQLPSAQRQRPHFVADLYRRTSQI